jgi:hypothetical protein
MASSIVLQSNENSALLQTLVQSESATLPAIYNTKEIYKPSATSFYNVTSVSGRANNNGTLTFNLPKYGILNQVLLNYKVVHEANRSVVGDVILGNDYDIYKHIDRVEFLSSSRVIQTIYFNSDGVAQYSDLTNTQARPLKNSCLVGGYNSRIGTAEEPARCEGTFTYPLHFPMFNDINTCPMLSFTEPSQIRIVFANFNTYWYAQALDPAIIPPVIAPATFGVTTLVEGGTPNGPDAPSLDLRYSMYNEADTAMILQENYGNEPSLNQVVDRWYRENPSSILSLKSENVANGRFDEDQAVITMELRNIDVVQSWYFGVFEVTDQTGPFTPVLDATRQTTGVGVCTNPLGGEGVLINDALLENGTGESGTFTSLRIRYVKIMASGQIVAELGPNQLQYSRIGDNGWATIADDVLADSIAKVQTGYLESEGGGPLSNGTSMRELTNMTAEIHFDPNDHLDAASGVVIAETTARFQAFCAEKTTAILSTASSTGRSQISLSN